MKRALFALVVAVILLCVSARDASAQLHFDASAHVGGMKRFLGSRRGGDDAGFGPAGQLVAHLALLPLVHFGGYFGHDLSPLADPASGRNITFGGARVKGVVPFIRGSSRVWVFVGFGYAGVYQRSYDLAEPTFGPGRVEGARGGFAEVPFGVGASYRLFKPWELLVELGGRAGFAHTGNVYETPGPRFTPFDSTQPRQNASPAGLDRFAVGLTVGVGIDL